MSRRRVMEPWRREAHRAGLRFFVLGLTVPPLLTLAGLWMVTR